MCIWQMLQEGWKDMANKQKLAKMMVDFISEYDFYDWSDSGQPGVAEHIAWLEGDPEGVKE